MTSIYTVGHSQHSIGEFLELLKQASLCQLADVRRFPGSRRHPHFAGAALAQSLAEEGMAYRHFPELGGHRGERSNSPHRAWESSAFRGYADHMESDEFRTALSHLENWARHGATVVMCAEADPARCHRRLLSDALLQGGFQVLHIRSPGQRQEHLLTEFARVDGNRIIYDGGMLPLGDGREIG